MASRSQQDTTLVSAESFARTYAGRTYEDPWGAVQDYRTIMDWQAGHPDEGASILARRFDLPRGRLQGWLDGSRPQPIHGLDMAISHGWIEADLQSDTVRGLNVLVAWIIQAGSIADGTYVPYFSVKGDRDRELLTAAAELANVELAHTRPGSASRLQEMRPAEAGAVLGRVLTVLGAPIGEDRSTGNLELPTHLEAGNERLAREFVQVYVHHLGRYENDRYYLHLRSSRPDDFIEAVAALIRRLTDEPVSVIETNVVLAPRDTSGE